jgi:3-oxoacyl-[acyl-carrier protein] reductase
METGLRGKALLAAASSEGLGFGIAEKALREGAKVYIGSRTKENVDAALARLAGVAAESGGSVAGSALDMASGDSIASWVASGLAEFGAIDALLVNAGGPPAGNFEAFGDDETWRKAFELTLLSSVRLIRAALPSLKLSRGSILTITSSSVKEPWPGLILSGVMRSGVASLVKSLSVELGPLGIRVNNLAPGKIMTGRLKKLLSSDAEKRGVSLEEQIAKSNGEIPLGRIGAVAEFAAAGVFLLSDAASYISGQTVLVDGGASKFLY